MHWFTFDSPLEITQIHTHRSYIWPSIRSRINSDGVLAEVMHTYIRTCAHTCVHTYTYVYTYMHAYIHTYTYIHTYIHTCIHYDCRDSMHRFTFDSLLEAESTQSEVFAEVSQVILCTCMCVSMRVRERNRERERVCIFVGGWVWMGVWINSERINFWSLAGDIEYL